MVSQVSIQGRSRVVAKIFKLVMKKYRSRISCWVASESGTTVSITFDGMPVGYFEDCWDEVNAHDQTLMTADTVEIPANTTEIDWQI